MAKSEYLTYEAATEAFLREMAHIDGSSADYREGLRSAIADLQAEIQASEECDNALAIVDDL
jgi:hypothetical protein